MGAGGLGSKRVHGIRCQLAWCLVIKRGGQRYGSAADSHVWAAAAVYSSQGGAAGEGLVPQVVAGSGGMLHIGVQALGCCAVARALRHGSLHLQVV